MTSRVWKYLGTDNFGRFTIAYRIDGEPLCVDCERDLVAEIVNALATSMVPPPAIHTTAKAYEGRQITWSIGPINEFTMPKEMAPVLAACICWPMHPTIQ